MHEFCEGNNVNRLKIKVHLDFENSLRQKDLFGSGIRSLLFRYCKIEGRWQRNKRSCSYITRSAGGDLWFYEPNRKIGVYSLLIEDNAKEERLRPFDDHQQEN